MSRNLVTDGDSGEYVRPNLYTDSMAKFETNIQAEMNCCACGRYDWLEKQYDICVSNSRFAFGIVLSSVVVITACLYFCIKTLLCKSVKKTEEDAALKADKYVINN